MNEKPQDLKPRTKAFALRVIRMYSELPKNDTVAQVLGKQVLRSGTKMADLLGENRQLIVILTTIDKRSKENLQHSAFNL